MSDLCCVVNPVGHCRVCRRMKCMDCVSGYYSDVYIVLCSKECATKYNEGGHLKYPPYDRMKTILGRPRKDL